MTGLRTTITAYLLICSIGKAAVIRHRQLPPVQITWITEYETAIDDVTSFELETITFDLPSQASPYPNLGVGNSTGTVVLIQLTHLS